MPAKADKMAFTDSTVMIPSASRSHFNMADAGLKNNGDRCAGAFRQLQIPVVKLSNRTGFA